MLAKQLHHESTDSHRHASWIADVVLGGQDGLVNVLGVTLGVAAASSSARLVLVAGLAAACTESVSMAAGAYTSNLARGDLFKSERAREYRHIQTIPDLEREEVRAIYATKGFSGELLDRIVTTITADKDVWVAVMMAEEHGLSDVDRTKSARSAVVVGVSALVGSLLPLVPFVLVALPNASWLAFALSAVSLFAFGVYKAKATVGDPLKSGLELATIGLVSALVGYAIGVLFHAPASL